MKHLIQFIGVILWLAGIVIAKGFWSTFFAILVPLWAWFIVVERVVLNTGLLS